MALRPLSPADYHGSVPEQGSSHAIAVRGLHKSYGDMPVLWDLDLTVDWGRFLVIFGANGSGKTTLLKVLSTQARPDAGEVWVRGVERSRNAAAIRRTIGVVAHRDWLYDDMTCGENLIFYGRMFSLKDPRRRADEVLALVGLERRKDRRVRTLSHGMRKRLSIARALLHLPAVLLLDEPEAGLDQEALDMLAEVLKEWGRAGRAVVMTTHNVERGLAWGEQVAILAEGRIVFERPRHSLDLAGFEGTYRQYLETAL